MGDPGNPFEAESRLSEIFVFSEAPCPSGPSHWAGVLHFADLMEHPFLREVKPEGWFSGPGFQILFIRMSVCLLLRVWIMTRD